MTWFEKIYILLNIVKRETPHLEKNNMPGKNRSGINWWGVSSAEKDLRG